MTDSNGGASEDHALYTSLAEWWPLISPPAEYEEEAEFAATLLRTGTRPVHEVLELGSGGGHNAVHLGAHFDMTLVDLSDDMLAVSRALNPEAEHVRGDMRSVRLGRKFDAVFVHDAVDYMTTQQDLARMVATAYDHCLPGGVAVFLPDFVAETFQPGTEHGGADAADGRGARYLEWTWDPDPTDTLVRSEYAFLLRDASGQVTTVTETHEFGLFPRQLWLDLLAAVGFQPSALQEETSENRVPRTVLLGHRGLG